MLKDLDMTLRLKRGEYERELETLQNTLHLLGYRVYVKKIPVAIVFEGEDAAGKGGAIKRVTERLDPRGYVVWPIAAPTGDDKDRHYLYRFWRRLPEQGQIALFDRSWYGRVLVERIEGFCTEAAWQRAYGEINQFELVNVNEPGFSLYRLALTSQLVERYTISLCRRDHGWSLHKITRETAHSLKECFSGDGACIGLTDHLALCILRVCGNSEPDSALVGLV